MRDRVRDRVRERQRRTDRQRQGHTDRQKRSQKVIYIDRQTDKNRINETHLMYRRSLSEPVRA